VQDAWPDGRLPSRQRQTFGDAYEQENAMMGGLDGRDGCRRVPLPPVVLPTGTGARVPWPAGAWTGRLFCSRRSSPWRKGWRRYRRRRPAGPPDGDMDRRCRNATASPGAGMHGAPRTTSPPDRSSKTQQAKATAARGGPAAGAWLGARCVLAGAQAGAVPRARHELKGRPAWPVATALPTPPPVRRSSKLLCARGAAASGLA